MEFLKNFFRQIKSFFRPTPYRLQTFTYYIPAPPQRKTGYREKEFDKTFYSFINQGYDILSMSTQSHHGPQGSGMWVIYTVRAKNAKADRLDLELGPASLPEYTEDYFKGPEITFLDEETKGL